MKATIILVPLMGFTWIIGLFAVGEEGRVFAYLFVFANVFQVREGTSLTITVFLRPSRSLSTTSSWELHAGFVHISASCCETREGVWKDERQASKI